MISLIKSTTKIGAFIVIIFGAIASLWTNCILITNLKNNMRSEMFIRSGYDEYNNIIWTIQLTYLCIFVIANGTLLWAFKKSRKNFLIPWSLLKFCENIILVIGSFAVYLRWSFYGLVPLGITSFVLNVYISISVYKTYKKIESKQLLKKYINDLEGKVQEENCEKIDQAIQTDATNFTIEIKKIPYNKEIRNNKENPFNFVHKHIPSTLG